MASVPFESARSVHILPDGHRSARLHGHSFLARIRASLPSDWAPFAGAEVTELHRIAEKSVAPLNYDLLNNHIEIPTDENLARWVRQHISLSTLDVVGIQSTKNQGVDIDKDNNAHIWRRFRFEAAHQLPNVPDGHQCGRMHGHGFEVILHANQQLAGKDIGIDFDQLKVHWQILHDQLHMNCLNDLPGLENPTSEVLAR